MKPAPSKTGQQASEEDLAARTASAADGALLRAWGERTIEQGVEQVEQQQQRLRRAGAIDDDGRRQVDLPTDMKPDSLTDT